MEQSNNEADKQLNSGDKVKLIKLLPKKSQLIDLNENETNFELRFNCQCESDEEFKLAIVTQDQLDSDDFEIDNAFKIAKKSISGNFSNKDNIYKNFFLVLNSGKELEINLLTDLRPIGNIPAAPQPGMPGMPGMPAAPQPGMPGMPGMPAAPHPGMPGMPGMPAANMMVEGEGETSETFQNPTDVVPKKSMFEIIKSNKLILFLILCAVLGVGYYIFTLFGGEKEYCGSEDKTHSKIGSVNSSLSDHRMHKGHSVQSYNSDHSQHSGQSVNSNTSANSNPSRISTRNKTTPLSLSKVKNHKFK